jgi:hypothetical protein
MSKSLIKCIVIVMALELVACDDSFDVKGAVTHCVSNLPLVDVRITLAVPGDENQSFTDADGKYWLDLLVRNSARVTVRADKPGYLPFELELDGAPENAVDFCLEPDPEYRPPRSDAGVDAGL